MVEKIGHIAEAAGQIRLQRGDVGGLEQQRHQGKIGALDLERGGGIPCEGNGHGEGNCSEKRQILTAAHRPVGPTIRRDGLRDLQNQWCKGFQCAGDLICSNFRDKKQGMHRPAAEKFSARKVSLSS
jgi:hypothetical protein